MSEVEARQALERRLISLEEKNSRINSVRAVVSAVVRRPFFSSSEIRRRSRA